MHLIRNNPEVIRRWVNEVQEAVNSQYDMVQYHAVALLYQIRQHDKLAVSKVNPLSYEFRPLLSIYMAFVVYCSASENKSSLKPCYLSFDKIYSNTFA
jgi:hypothetical protein